MITPCCLLPSHGTGSRLFTGWFLHGTCARICSSCCWFFFNPYIDCNCGRCIGFEDNDQDYIFNVILKRPKLRNIADLGIDKVHCFVCVFFPFILDIKFVGRTSRGHTGGRSHRISHPPYFCGACLNFSREKDSAIPFPRRP